MNSQDETRRVLEELLAQLHSKQATTAIGKAEAYLQARDGQFLGKITSNRFDSQSLASEYGPFGSKYSQTSIFNPYSMYGSKYGLYSVNNPQCFDPPVLIVNERVIARVSANPRISDRISPESFKATLHSNPELLLEGRTVRTADEQRRVSFQAYIEASDGTFLGKLNPNAYDADSIFNKYGRYGSAYSPTCIFNEYSTYGGPYSTLSPFNEYSSTPPKVFVSGAFVGYLTVNSYLQPRIDPHNIKEWAENNVAAYG